MTKSLGDMTPEERREFAVRNWEEQKQAHAGEPVPRISRVKREDYPHWDLGGHDFSMRPGAPARVGRDGTTVSGEILGLRDVADGGTFALLVRLGDEDVWAARRADGVEAWATVREQQRQRTEDLDVPVDAWPVSSAAADEPASPVAGPRRPTRWTLRTTDLEETA